MSDETNEFRDVHYTKSRYAHQIKKFEIDASKENFENWKIYEAWLIGHGRKLPTILKQFGAFKRILNHHPKKQHRLPGLVFVAIQSVFLLSVSFVSQFESVLELSI